MNENLWHDTRIIGVKNLSLDISWHVSDQKVRSSIPHILPPSVYKMDEMVLLL